MFKRTPNNCFKQLFSCSGQTSDTASQDKTQSSTTTESSKLSNHVVVNGGPVMTYFNYFLLPQVDLHICENGSYKPLEIQIKYSSEHNVYISSSIYAHLCDIKHQIEQYQDTWDNIKKFTNPYEYIHSNVSGNKTNISRLRPLSRSFYKMIEIVKNNDMLSHYNNTYTTKPDSKMGIKTFHLAEGPGGFIEAIAYLRGIDYQRHIHNEKNTKTHVSGGGIFDTLHETNTSSSPIHILKRNTDFHDEYMKEQEYLKVSRRIFDIQNETNGTVESGNGGGGGSITYGNDRYYGMTLLNDDPICPGWKKTRSFLEGHPNVMIENGADKTGNLISLDNFLYCAEKYKNMMDIVTADGGFDFSVDFNKQENIATLLILCEVFYALAIQKQGGSFILKIFDVFHKSTVDILYLLSYYYKNVSIMKPYTSRIANSEKYIICQDFKVIDSSAIIEQFANVFPSLLNDGIATSFLPFDHDLYFLNRIEEMNAIVSFQQIENITSTLSIITNHRNAEKLEQYKRTNVNKCIAWCEKYDIPYNAHHACFQSTNIFLHKSIPQSSSINTRLQTPVGVGVGVGVGTA